MHCEMGVRSSLRDFLAVPMASPSLEDEIGTRGRAEDSGLALGGLDDDLGGLGGCFSFSLSDISMPQTGGSVEMSPCC